MIRGYYSPEIQRLLTLDSLSSHLKIYRLNCNLERTLTIDGRHGGSSNGSTAKKKKEEGVQRSAIIMSFAWSERE